VGLSALDKDLNSLQIGSQLSYADVLRKMSTFEQSVTARNGTLNHVWLSRDGKIDRFLHFPSPSYGIDANKTFENAGLVIFTDANVTQKYDNCNRTQGFLSCLDGTCYHSSKTCDGKFDCRDGTDEGSCIERDEYNLAQFRMTRTNRLQRLYDNTWPGKISILDLSDTTYSKLRYPTHPSLGLSMRLV
jgi:CD109 antigen